MDLTKPTQLINHDVAGLWRAGQIRRVKSVFMHYDKPKDSLHCSFSTQMSECRKTVLKLGTKGQLAMVYLLKNVRTGNVPCVEII
jgi:hypothetical protein